MFSLVYTYLHDQINVFVVYFVCERKPGTERAIISILSVRFKVFTKAEAQLVLR